MQENFEADMNRLISIKITPWCPDESSNKGLVGILSIVKYQFM